MSGIVLSASVRQNLLSLQSTADLLATTQERLSTGKKVNTALDNPTNFFTAQGLDNRASDISNLLDGINNGVQVLQAANTGITSLQKLIDSAKSIANQALQTTVGYSTKSNVSPRSPVRRAADLRGTTTYASATANSNVLYTGAAGGVTPAAATALGATLGATAGALPGPATPPTARTALSGTITLLGTTAPARPAVGNAQPADGDTLTVNGKTITFRAGVGPGRDRCSGRLGRQRQHRHRRQRQLHRLSRHRRHADATVSDVLTAIDLASGVEGRDQQPPAPRRSFSAVGRTRRAADHRPAQVTLKSSTGADLSVTGKADFLKALGLTPRPAPATPPSRGTARPPRARSAL